jgi:hypothetical protein
MKSNPSEAGSLTANSSHIGALTCEAGRRRAYELAIVNGRSPVQVSKSDWERARRELTGLPDSGPKTVVLESTVESERWDPVPRSAGHKVPSASNDDEDEEGRGDKEKLVEASAAGAGHDQMRRAAGESRETKPMNTGKNG